MINPYGGFMTPSPYFLYRPRKPHALAECFPGSEQQSVVTKFGFLEVPLGLFSTVVMGRVNARIGITELLLYWRQQ
jgi:hypothetical protein